MTTEGNLNARVRAEPALAFVYNRKPSEDWQRAVLGVVVGVAVRRDRTIRFATTRRGDGMTMRAAAVCDKARLLLVVVLLLSKGRIREQGEASGTEECQKGSMNSVYVIFRINFVCMGERCSSFPSRPRGSKQPTRFQVEGGPSRGVAFVGQVPP